jgi:hypothetical protein
MTGHETSKSLIGLPVGVGNSVDLGRKLSDAEWERLLGDLRETFDARGKVQSDGNFRQWTNSRLQILVEPTPDGHRVRFKTYNRTLVGYMGIGSAMLAMAAFSIVSMAVADQMGEPRKVIGPFIFATAGVLSIAWGALRLPRWARTRRQQFKDLIDRLMLPR